MILPIAPPKPKVLAIAKSITWAMILGTVFYVLATGGDIFWAQNITWLSSNDPLTSWLGWSFYRHTPLLQWPIGANWNYGMELSSSIVYSDSIPLLAIPLKLIRFVLPDTFQYFGLWIWICFVLQIFWSQKLLELYIPAGWLTRIASLLFAIAPVFLWRLHGHYALFGQWLILAAFYLYLSKQKSVWLWTLLLSMSALTQAYLLMMILLVWGAYQLTLLRLQLTNLSTQLLQCATTLSVTLLVMWTAGYFMLGGGLSTWGFGFYRMNLLAPLDADGMWSRILPDITNAAGDYEGFSYLGLGMLALIPLALYLKFKQKPWQLKTEVLVLFCLCILLIGYAASNHIALGRHELFAYTLPGQWLQHIANTFRNSGRFFWPVYYLIYLTVLVLICTRLTPPKALLACIMAITIQLADSQSAFKYFYQKYQTPQTSSEQMSSPSWSLLLAPYDNLMVVLPQNQSPHWQAIALLAARHQKNVNVGYFARVNFSKEEQARRDLAQKVLEKRLDKNALYLFEDTALWQLALTHQNPNDLLGTLNGMHFLAPDFKSLSQDERQVTPYIIPPKQFNLQLGSQALVFSDQGKGRGSTLYGWAQAEALGTWSNGKRAALLIDLANAPKAGAKLTLTADAFVLPEHPKQEVQAWINGEPTTSWIHTEQHNLQSVSLLIPSFKDQQPSNLLLIEFVFKQAISPSELGLSDDSRKLGIRLKSITLDSQ